MADKRTIPVSILGQEYRIRSDADEELIRRAAAIVDATMLKLRSRTSTADTQDVAVLAALNIANHLVALQDGATEVAPAATLSQDELAPLIELVESVLHDEAVASH